MVHATGSCAIGGVPRRFLPQSASHTPEISMLRPGSTPGTPSLFALVFAVPLSPSIPSVTEVDRCERMRKLDRGEALGKTSDLRLLELSSGFICNEGHLPLRDFRSRFPGHP